MTNSTHVHQAVSTLSGPTGALTPDAAIGNTAAPTGEVKPSHTQGPWDFARMLSASENDKGFRVVSHASRYSGGRWIADVSPVNDSDGNASAEGLANVRLIAAAPELLDIAETIALGIKRGYTPAELLDENSPVMDRIRAAIAKATGEQA